jgi:DNA-directed RNA polymerase specialized sigma24 family protein
MVAMSELDKEEINNFTESEMYVRERQELLQRALNALGEKCKRLLTFYQLHYSMKEIASEMGYASDQVAMNQWSECRKKLKKLIENNQELNELLNFYVIPPLP